MTPTTIQFEPSFRLLDNGKRRKFTISGDVEVWRDGAWHEESRGSPPPLPARPHAATPRPPSAPSATSIPATASTPAPTPPVVARAPAPPPDLPPTRIADLERDLIGSLGARIRRGDRKAFALAVDLTLAAPDAKQQFGRVPDRGTAGGWVVYASGCCDQVGRFLLAPGGAR